MNGILLVILAVSGNFIAELMGCQVQKVLTENMIIKHMVLIFIIYFSLGFTSNNNPNPTILLQNSFYIWVLFLMFSKMSIKFNIAIFGLIAIYHYIYTYINYYKSIDPKLYKNEINKLNNTLDHLIKIIIALLIIGFVLYFRQQKKDHIGDWSTPKFIFGVNKCKSLI